MDFPNKLSASSRGWSFGSIQDPSAMARLLAEPVKGKLPIGV